MLFVPASTRLLWKSLCAIALSTNSLCYAQEAAPPSSGDQAPSVVATTSYPVQFSPGIPQSPLAPRFTPKGTAIKLAPAEQKGLPGVDHLVGRIVLGAEEFRGDGILICLARGEAGKPYDTLLIDVNQDGKLHDETPVTVAANVVRGNIWTSFNDLTLQVRHSADADSRIDYPISLWAVVAAEEETPELIRFTRTGFLQGAVTIDDKKYHVVVADGNNDGNFGGIDSWGICLASDQPRPEKPIWRRMNDFTWGGEKAWKLTMTGADGAAGVITPHHPGLSQQEDEEQRDYLRADRIAKRAAQPLQFATDYDAAIKQAADEGKPCFIKFETTWCIPCKQMDAFVFTAQDVVDAAANVVCIKLDGGKRKELAEKYKVAGYPTGILIAPTGDETARFSGYRSVKQMTQFFQAAAQ